MWFQAQLRGNAGREALAYLERRGVDRATASTFELGYAPNDGQSLRQALRSQGFADAELIAAGLVKEGEDREPYAHFRNRLMFPIADERGRLVGFGGRALGEARAKYLNTPETEIFHKGELLYNLPRAKASARERRELVLAEGYMDVIALAQAGIATGGGAAGHGGDRAPACQLWRLAEAPIVCLDGDAAGLAAAMRAAERALPVMRGGQTLRFVVLPDGDDPDSYLRRHGPDALAGLLSKAHTLSQMIWQLETQGRRFDTPEARAALSRRLRTLARWPAMPTCASSLLDQFRSLQGSAARRAAQRGQKGPRTRGERLGGRRAGPASRPASRGVRWVARRRSLQPLLRQPDWLHGHEEEFAQLQLRDRDLERLRQEIVAWFERGRQS